MVLRSFEEKPRNDGFDEGYGAEPSCGLADPSRVVSAGMADSARNNGAAPVESWAMDDRSAPWAGSSFFDRKDQNRATIPRAESPSMSRVLGAPIYWERAPTSRLPRGCMPK